MSKAEILLVHCVDTEGPIGGNVRRRSYGGKEFMGTWKEIETSIDNITHKKFRTFFQDSYGQMYRYNWFIMDFTGFKTNPKKRIAKYNNTYDHFKRLKTGIDGFYWHYHHPPTSGIGDQWSDDWDSSNEYMNILLHRLAERGDFPEVFRAGGTIEDNKASLWLEDNIMLDYSNRVSASSKPADNIFDFNWYGAPNHWGFYHPNRKNFLKSGNMRRYIIRSLDLWSRLHVLTLKDVRAAFNRAHERQEKIILSSFSHDHREMRDEVAYGVSLVRQVSRETGIPWRSMNALEAVQEAANIKPVQVKVSFKKMDNSEGILKFSNPPYQRKPFIAARFQNGDLQWLDSTRMDPLSVAVHIPRGVRELITGGTSESGNKFVKRFVL